MKGLTLARRSVWGLLLLGSLVWQGCRKAPDVVCYCAQDQLFAEPLFEKFQKDADLRVAPVFDSEAVKSVGLANRLIAERSHPVADVFWGNEELQTRRLAAAGLFRIRTAPDGQPTWAAFGYRARRLVAAAGRAELTRIGLEALTNTEYRGRISLAAPWFGSTLTHFLALRAEWGVPRWQAWCRALAANKPFLEEGNSHVIKRVVRGDAWIGLTDSDDIRYAQREGFNLAAGPDLWRIRNTVAVMNNAPHPAAAEKLFQFLQSNGVRESLCSAGALESGDVVGQTIPESQWATMLQSLDPATQELREFFAR